MPPKFPLLAATWITAQTDKSSICSQVRCPWAEFFLQLTWALAEPTTLLDRKNTPNSTSARAPAPQQLGRGGWWMPLLCLYTGEAFFSCQCGIWRTQLFSFILHLGLNCISPGTCPILINIKLPDHPFELEQFLTTNRPESQIFEWLVAGWEQWMLGELNDSWPDSFTMVRVVGMSQLRFLWQNLSLKWF